MSLSCSDSEHDHAQFRTKGPSRCLSLYDRKGSRSQQQPSLQSSGIATPPPSPPSSRKSLVKTEHQMDIEPSHRQFRRIDSDESEPQVKRRRLNSSQHTRYQDLAGEINPSPVMPIAAERLAARERCNGRLTRSLTSPRTVFYELGASSTAANLDHIVERDIPNRVTISIPRRRARHRSAGRRERHISERQRASRADHISDQPGLFHIPPLTQTKFEIFEDQDADDNWRWATQLSSDSDDDWRWKTQSRSPSWEGNG